MRSKFVTRLTPLILMLVIAGSMLGCKKNNDVESALKDYGGLLDLAKYIYYNISSNDRVKGVYKLSLVGTEAFDSGYWGWEEPTYFLENSRKTLSTYKTIKRPLLGSDLFVSSSLPGNIYNQDGTNPDSTFDSSQPWPYSTAIDRSGTPFSSGSFSTSLATTEIFHPTEIEAITRTKKDVSGDETTDDNPVVYTIQYDDFTGLPTLQILNEDSSGDTLYTSTYEFSEDPRSYGDIYVSSLKNYDDSSNLVGSISFLIETDETNDNSSETYTYQRYDSSNSLGSFDATDDLKHFDSNLFSDANGATIVKVVTTITDYQKHIESTDPTPDTIETVTEKYSDDSTIVYKEVTYNYYDNYDLRQLGNYWKYTYNVSGSTETLASKQARTYENGFLIKKTTYSVSNGTATPKNYEIYSRDSQGRITAYEKQDSDGNTTIRKDYTFDSSNRTESIRSYNIDSSTNEESCRDDENIDYTYQTDESLYKVISTDYYDCDGSNLASSPTYRYTDTYNTKGQLTRKQKYSYPAETNVLTYQIDYEYGSSHELSLKTEYEVVTGVASVSSYTEYTYDSNLFLISEKSLDASGDVSSPYYEYNYTYK